MEHSENIDPKQMGSRPIIGYISREANSKFNDDADLNLSQISSIHGSQGSCASQSYSININLDDNIKKKEKRGYLCSRPTNMFVTSQTKVQPGYLDNSQDSALNNSMSQNIVLSSQPNSAYRKESMPNHIAVYLDKSSSKRNLLKVKKAKERQEKSNNNNTPKPKEKEINESGSVVGSCKGSKPVTMFTPGGRSTYVRVIPETQYDDKIDFEEEPTENLHLSQLQLQEQQQLQPHLEEQNESQALPKEQQKLQLLLKEQQKSQLLLQEQQKSQALLIQQQKSQLLLKEQQKSQPFVQKQQVSQQFKTEQIKKNKIKEQDTNNSFKETTIKDNQVFDQREKKEKHNTSTKAFEKKDHGTKNLTNNSNAVIAGKQIKAQHSKEVKNSIASVKTPSVESKSKMKKVAEKVMNEFKGLKENLMNRSKRSKKRSLYQDDDLIPSSLKKNPSDLSENKGVGGVMDVSAGEESSGTRRRRRRKSRQVNMHQMRGDEVDSPKVVSPQRDSPPRSQPDVNLFQPQLDVLKRKPRKNNKGKKDKREISTKDLKQEKKIKNLKSDFKENSDKDFLQKSEPKIETENIKSKNKSLNRKKSALEAAEEILDHSSPEVARDCVLQHRPSPLNNTSGHTRNFSKHEKSLVNLFDSSDDAETEIKHKKIVKTPKWLKENKTNNLRTSFPSIEISFPDVSNECSLSPIPIERSYINTSKSLNKSTKRENVMNHSTSINRKSINLSKKSEYDEFSEDSMIQISVAKQPKINNYVAKQPELVANPFEYKVTTKQHAKKSRKSKKSFDKSCSGESKIFNDPTPVRKIKKKKREIKSPISTPINQVLKSPSNTNSSTQESKSSHPITPVKTNKGKQSRLDTRAILKSFHTASDKINLNVSVNNMEKNSTSPNVLNPFLQFTKNQQSKKEASFVKNIKNSQQEKTNNFVKEFNFQKVETDNSITKQQKYFKQRTTSNESIMSRGKKVIHKSERNKRRRERLERGNRGKKVRSLMRNLQLNLVESQKLAEHFNNKRSENVEEFNELFKICEQRHLKFNLKMNKVEQLMGDHVREITSTVKKIVVGAEKNFHQTTELVGTFHKTNYDIDKLCNEALQEVKDRFGDNLERFKSYYSDEM